MSAAVTFPEQLFAQLSLPPAFAAAFFAVADKQELPRNGYLVRQGEVSDCVGLVETGCLYSVIETDHGDERVDDFFVPGSVIASYRSFLTRCPSPGSIRAYRASTVYTIPHRQYTALSHSAEWLMLFKHISDTLFIRKCLKSSSLTTRTAAERYADLAASHPGIEQLFPQYLIASFLGVRPETLSRLKSLDLHQ